MTQKSELLLSNNEGGYVPPALPASVSTQKGETSLEREEAGPNDIIIAARLWSLPDLATVSTEQAASMLQRSKRTLEGWRLRHTGPAYQAGGRVTYTVGALKAYVASQTVTPTTY